MSHASRVAHLEAGIDTQQPVRLITRLVSVTAAQLADKCPAVGLQVDLTLSVTTCPFLVRTCTSCRQAVADRSYCRYCQLHTAWRAPARSAETLTKGLCWKSLPGRPISSSLLLRAMDHAERTLGGNTEHVLLTSSTRLADHDLHVKEAVDGQVLQHAAPIAITKSKGAMAQRTSMLR